MSTFTARKSSNANDIVGQDYECTKCLKCLKPATTTGCGYVLLGDTRVTAAWCDTHGGTGPGLLNQRDKPLGSKEYFHIDKSTCCWGGWHENYGLKIRPTSRG